jgi:sugar phosphate isomerase/epimerase
MFSVPGPRDKFELNIEEFIRFAKSVGYDGIALRPGQLDQQTSAKEVDRIAELLKQNEMACSFAMGGSVSDGKSYDAHRKLVDDALKIGCRHIQPSVRNEAEIPWIQKLCDYAAERDVRVAPQLHDSTLHDTVPHCLDLFKKVGRENFGLNFEASHLLMQSAEIRGAEAVKALGGKIFTVCVQNYKKENGNSVPVLPGDPDGVDFEELFGAIVKTDFDGFVTHMSGSYPDMGNRAVCQAYVERLQPLMGAGR